MSIVVTGATGQLGALVIERLLQLVPAAQVVAGVRSVEKAAHLQEQGVQVRVVDYEKPETLTDAFNGAERVLLISGTEGDRFTQHKHVIDAAKAAGVNQLVYTSLVKANDSTLSLADDHKRTEQYLKEVGITHTILRNNWYLENEADSLKGAAQGAPLVHATGTAKIGWAARLDFAHAAAAVLTEQGHENKVYELSGQLLTYDDLGALLSEVIGKEVTVQAVDAAAYTDRLRGFGLPDGVAAFVAGFQTAIGEGSLDVPSADLEKLLGRPQQPLQEAMKELLA